MPILEWNDTSDWDSSQSSSGIDHNNDPYTSSSPGKLKQGYQKQWPPMTHGLVGWWPLHTDTPVDLSGNGNHGTKNGGVTTGVAGKAGLQAMSLDGSDDHIDFGNVAFSGDKATWSIWVKTTDSGASSVFGKNLGSPNRSYFLRIGRNNSGKLTFFGSSDGSNYTEVDGSTRIDDGDWHHIVVVFDGQNTELTIYVDGEVDASETGFYSTLNTNSEELYIGANSGGLAFLNGKVVDFRHYSRTLSQSEIQTLYEWGKSDQASPPTDGTARYKLDGNVNDEWSNKDGTNNGANFVDDAIRGQAASFNGGDHIDLSGGAPDSSFSVSTWFKADSFESGDHGNIYHLDESGSWGQAFLLVTEGDKIQFRVSDGSQTLTTEDSEYSTGVWYHATGVCKEGDALYLYVNGVEVDSVSFGTLGPTSNVHEIGGNVANDTNYYLGLIDDVRIYDRALSPQEVFELYQWGTRGINMNKFTVMQ